MVSKSSHWSTEAILASAAEISIQEWPFGLIGMNWQIPFLRMEKRPSVATFWHTVSALAAAKMATSIRTLAVCWVEVSLTWMSTERRCC